ncbi:hypothetical protein QZH41_019038, partial [Actinostola sp. cb2023]
TYALKSISNIEKTRFMNGSRYLIELELSTPSNATIHLSEYIYLHNNSLCYFKQWRRNAAVTFVITAKNQGKWIHVFLENISTILQETQDPNINIIIFDYESEDIDLVEAIASRGLEKRAKTMRKQGKYSRRESFNLAVELVTDPHSIVFILDLHLTMGVGLLNDIRKHTVEGQLMYAPIIIRQWDHTTPQHKYKGNYGFYETYGYGLVAMYKSDWDRVGGFPTPYKAGTYKWGGEDYDLMDSVFKKGLDHVRVKCPYVYHYYHERKGMWDKSDP